MAMDIGLNCTLKGAKCYLAACIESGVCKLASAAVDRIVNSTSASTPCADSTTTGSANTTSSAATSCHYGLYPLGTIGKAKIWVGRAAAVCRMIKGQPKPVALVINVMGDDPWRRKEDTGEVTGNKGARKLLPKGLFDIYEPTPEMIVDWPDFGIPTMDRRWWLRLNAALAKIDGDVILHCQGGHGRTGTAASILAAMNGWAGTDRCPVEWLRSVYCDKAVECKEQIDYIADMAECHITSTPHMDWKQDWGTDQGYGYLSAGKLGGDPKAVWKGGPGGGYVTVTTPKPRKLSIRQYRKWLRRQAHKGKLEVAVKNLTDNAMCLVEGEWYQWSAVNRKFTWKCSLHRDK